MGVGGYKQTGFKQKVLRSILSNNDHQKKRFRQWEEEENTSMGTT